MGRNHALGPPISPVRGPAQTGGRADRWGLFDNSFTQSLRASVSPWVTVGGAPGPVTVAHKHARITLNHGSASSGVSCSFIRSGFCFRVRRHPNKLERTFPPHRWPYKTQAHSLLLRYLVSREFVGELGRGSIAGVPLLPYRPHRAVCHHRRASLWLDLW